MGKLFVIEGLDGTGKCTQANKLYDRIYKLGYEVQLLSFPDYESRACEPVKMYLEGEFGNDPEDINAYAISSFYAIDRYVSYVKNWKKLWDKDIIFIADRYVDSNAIYQMTKLPQNEWKEFIEWLHKYEHNLLTLPKPTKTFFLDIPQNISDQLITKRYQGNDSKKDIHEKDMLFQQKCRDTALYCALNLNWITINCCNDNKLRDVEEINDDIFKYIMEDLKNDIKN